MGNEIIPLNEDTWRIENDGVRFFLLTGRERALLIDTGMTAPNAREIAASLTDLPMALLNTHADRDHISGNAAFHRSICIPPRRRTIAAAAARGPSCPFGTGMSWISGTGY